MKTLPSLARIVCLAGAIAGLASADSITQYAYVDSSFAGETLTSSSCASGALSGCTMLNYPNGSGDLFFSLQQFDSSLGTLNSVTIDLIGTASDSTTVTNASSTSPATVSSFQGNLDFFTYAPSLTQPTNQTFPVGVPATAADSLIVAQTNAGSFQSGGKGGPPAITLSPTDCQEPCADYTTFSADSIDQFSLSPATAYVDGAGGDWSASGYQVNSGVFDYGEFYDPSIFVGSPSVDVYIPVYTELVYTLSGSGAVYADTSGYGEAELIVTYNYTPGNGSEIPGSPEPGTMVLLGSALVGIGLIGRQRYRKS